MLIANFFKLEYLRNFKVENWKMLLKKLKTIPLKTYLRETLLRIYSPLCQCLGSLLSAPSPPFAALRPTSAPLWTKTVSLPLPSLTSIPLFAYQQTKCWIGSTTAATGDCCCEICEIILSFTLRIIYFFKVTMKQIKDISPLVWIWSLPR